MANHWAKTASGERGVGGLPGGGGPIGRFVIVSLATAAALTLRRSGWCGGDVCGTPFETFEFVLPLAAAAVYVAVEGAIRLCRLFGGCRGGSGGDDPGSGGGRDRGRGTAEIGAGARRSEAAASKGAPRPSGVASGERLPAPTMWPDLPWPLGMANGWRAPMAGVASGAGMPVLPPRRLWRAAD